jgi:hypothetical protein
MAARKKPNVAFEEECRKALLAVAGSYAKARKLSLSTVSRDFYGHAEKPVNGAQKSGDGNPR